MSDAATQPPLLFVVFEIACWLAGIVLGARFLAGRLGPTRPALAQWKTPLDGFVVCVLLVILGGILLPYVPPELDESLLGPAATDVGWWRVVQGATFQFGMLGGALLGALILRLLFRAPPEIGEEPPPLPPPAPTSRPVLAGLVTFLIALPLIGGLGFAWKWILDQLGYSTSEQEMVDLFRNADDPALLALMIGLAAVLAPVTEELTFRAGLFRYLRTRVPRWIALLAPALLFALLHVNWQTLAGLNSVVPLVALAVFFAVAYERTGRIAVPMIAHALFNLHTIVLVMAGFTG